MRPELEEIQLLERYLQQTLPEEQAQDLEIRLLWDQELQQRLMAQKTACLAIREAGRQQLRQELRQIHRQLFR